MIPQLLGRPLTFGDEEQIEKIKFEEEKEKIKTKLKSDKEFLKLKTEYLNNGFEIEKLQTEQDNIYNQLANILNDRYGVDSEDAYYFI